MNSLNFFHYKYIKSRTSEANGRNSNKMLIFQKDIRKDDFGISKAMKVSLPNLNDKDFKS